MRIRVDRKFCAAVLAALLLIPLRDISAWPQQAKTPPAKAKAAPARPPSQAVQFVDVTRAAGIDFHLTCGSREKRYIMDSLCGGVAVLDYDRDGWMDIFFVNGSTLDGLSRGTSPPSKLYRNNGDGTFTDVTARAGITRTGWGMGAAVGDYDNDGWDDLYITYLDGGALLRNKGDGTFADVTETAGVNNGGRWGTSAAFGDYDGDGRLDLYIANYVTLDLQHLPEFGSSVFCQYRGIPVSCGPRGLPGSRDRLYHNKGDGTFEDVAERLGIDPDSLYGLGVVWGDYDNDGDQDVYVANDSHPSLLYRNNGDGTFTETALLAGVAFSADGREQAGMGVDFGDYDNDGWLDLTKTNFSDDTNNLYHNGGDGTFEDAAGAAGFGPISSPFLGFGVRFFDYDNDGWKDILVANGHVNPQVDAHSFGVSYAQRALLFRNKQGGQFEELGLRAGAGLRPTRVSRGLAVWDFDNDGDLDVVLTNLDGPPALLRNDSRPESAGLKPGATGGGGRNHSIQLHLTGADGRPALGARVEVIAGPLRQTDEARRNSSYLSASDPRLHFGLGSAVRVQRIAVRWPSGKTESVENEAAGQELTLEEGRGVVARRPFGRAGATKPAKPAAQRPGKKSSPGY